ncbi:MAG: ptk [Gemmataceae bacterium]|nr:ptk [Gemmataceae bacterium]
MNGPTFAHAPAAAPPAAAPKPAPPRPPAPPKAAARPDPDAGNGLRVLTYLRLHWLMIVFCGTLLGGAGAYAAWELLPSKFESYALLQVSSVPSSLANQGNPNQARTDFTTYVKTTSALIKSEFVLNAALRDIKDLPTIKEQKEPIKFLDEEVMVNWQDGSEVVRVTFKGNNPGDVKKVVDGVQRAFMAEVVQKDVAEKISFLGKVQDAKEKMQDLLEKRAKKPELVKAGPAGPVPPAEGVQQAGLNQPAGPLPPGNPNAPAGPPAPLVGPGDDILLKLNPGALVGRFAGLLGEADRLPIEIQILRERLRELEGKVKALKEAPLSEAALAAADRDEGVIRESLFALQAKRSYEVARGLGNENAPDVVNMKAVWDGHKARHKQIREEKAQALERAKRLGEVDKLLAEWESVKHQIERLEAQKQVTMNTLDRIGKRLNDVPAPAERGAGDSLFAREKGYLPENTDLATLDSIFARLVAQHQMVKLELDSPARVRLIQPASSPTQKDMRKQILGTVFAGLMGYAVIALGVVAFETLSRRVSSLADLKSAGPAPVVGVIPCLPGEATGHDPAKRAAANEAIDKLRAYVAQTWLSRGATTVALTSPLGDEGKAFTAFGLASSLAQAGYKTLAVDFDLRDPALHTYAGVPNQGGVCEILRAEADVRTAIQTLPSGLDLLPAGKWSDEARKAAVGGRLEALLARLKEPYDCVILHGHALLTAAESVEVARRCEVVLVCARYRETKVPLLRKATDRVAAMEIPYSGVVYIGASEQEALC